LDLEFKKIKILKKYYKFIYKVQTPKKPSFLSFLS